MPMPPLMMHGALPMPPMMQGSMPGPPGAPFFVPAGGGAVPPPPAILGAAPPPQPPRRSRMSLPPPKAPAEGADKSIGKAKGARIGGQRDAIAAMQAQMLAAEAGGADPNALDI